MIPSLYYRNFEAWHRIVSGVKPDIQEIVDKAILLQSFNPELAEYVLIDQQNYSMIPNQLTDVINGSYKNLIEALNMEKEKFENMFTLMRNASKDAHQILVDKNCTIYDMSQFFSDLIYTKGSQVTQKISSMTTHQWPSFPTYTLINIYVSRLNSCMVPTNTVQCLVEVTIYISC